jgi:dihydroxyacid dehydratase/phosphogluconate dehydratase
MHTKLSCAQDRLKKLQYTEKIDKKLPTMMIGANKALPPTVLTSEGASNRGRESKKLTPIGAIRIEADMSASHHKPMSNSTQHEGLTTEKDYSQPPL